MFEKLKLGKLLKETDHNMLKKWKEKDKDKHKKEDQNKNDSDTSKKDQVRKVSIQSIKVAPIKKFNRKKAEENES